MSTISEDSECFRAVLWPHPKNGLWVFELLDFQSSGARDRPPTSVTSREELLTFLADMSVDGVLVEDTAMDSHHRPVPAYRMVSMNPPEILSAIERREEQNRDKPLTVCATQVSVSVGVTRARSWFSARRLAAAD